jgi:hypothetical protein
VERIIEQDAASAAAQGVGGDACGQADGETRICGDTQMGDEAGGACAAADVGSGGGVGSGTSISSAGCVGGGASGDACIAAVGGGVGGKEGEGGVDPYCIRMEGVGHPSPDNDHNYIVYARVVGMEGVEEEDEGMESGDVMDPAEEWHTQVRQPLGKNLGLYVVSFESREIRLLFRQHIPTNVESTSTGLGSSLGLHQC